MESDSSWRKSISWIDGNSLHPARVGQHVKGIRGWVAAGWVRVTQPSKPERFRNPFVHSNTCAARGEACGGQGMARESIESDWSTGHEHSPG